MELLARIQRAMIEMSGTLSVVILHHASCAQKLSVPKPSPASSPTDEKKRKEGSLVLVLIGILSSYCIYELGRFRTELIGLDISRYCSLLLLTKHLTRKKHWTEIDTALHEATLKRDKKWARLPKMVRCDCWDDSFPSSMPHVIDTCHTCPGIRTQAVTLNGEGRECIVAYKIAA